MSFTSIEFAIFLPIVFILYWFVVNGRTKFQNLLLLLASYLFYGWWDWRFLVLLFTVSFCNYLIGLQIDKKDTSQKKKRWLIAALIINIGFLGFFKYYNFFIESFIDLVSLIGYNLPKSTTSIIIPLGISFYIFLSISYIVDIFKEKLKADKNVIEVLLTLSFFPIILAGPIQRPFLLLPQIIRERRFSYDQVVDGLRQILWGLFAKIVIADKLAYHVNYIFLNYSDYSGSTLFIGALFYTIQIYADFSGYSNIAIGTAKLFGFALMSNFSYPYFSRDITEFWKRWHISLTSWFRDYVFLPLSFSLSWKIKHEQIIFIKKDMILYIIASIITWFLTGLWHGANYTFIIWGLIHAFFLIIYQWQRKPRKRLFNKIGITNDNSLVIIIETSLTMIIILITWIFFRSNSIHDSTRYISGMFSPSLFTLPQVFPVNIIFLSSLFFIWEWLQKKKEHPLQIGFIKSKLIRRLAYYGILIVILISFSGSQQNFIYSQF